MNYVGTYKRLAKGYKTQKALADALDCSQPLVWKWLNGKATMSAHLAFKAEKLTHGKFKAYELCPKLAEFAEQLKSPKRELGADSPTKRKANE